MSKRLPIPEHVQEFMLTNEAWIAKFHAKVDSSGGPDACWPWLGGLSGSDGYGGTTLPKSLGWLKPYGGTRRLPAHRVALALSVGHFSEAQAIRHAAVCSASGGAGKLCCNPRHLAPGTDKDNFRDWKAEGTTSRRKVSDTHVMAARVLHRVNPKVFNPRKLAAMFGGASMTMKNILARRTRVNAPEWDDVRPKRMA
jgi:hypothetical protein